MAIETPEFILEFERPLRDLQRQIDALRTTSDEHSFDVSKEVAAIEKRIEETKRNIYSNLSPWHRVQLSRHPKRPFSLDYIKLIFEDFQELHGDRVFGDDQALIGGTATFNGEPVMIIAQQKGRDVKENLRRNFGMPHPEGYRKALRLFQMAEKFNLPIICFIDTKAAYAGVGSEERHVSEAIARNLREMAILGVPIVGVILGEGGSGGALGIAVVDRLLVLEHAYYSVIPPEGCAAILWRNRAFAEQAADALKLGARELLAQGIADSVVDEPIGGAHRDPVAAATELKKHIVSQLKILKKLPLKKLLDERYHKYRQMGKYAEEAIESLVAAKS